MRNSPSQQIQSELMKDIVGYATMTISQNLNANNLPIVRDVTDKRSLGSFTKKRIDTDLGTVMMNKQQLSNNNGMDLRVRIFESSSYNVAN